MKKFVWLFCLMMVGVFVAAQNTGAQGTAASIRGTVVDPSGSLVSNAALTAIQIETGLTRAVSSDAHGEYTFVELPIGHYRLQAEAKGFQRYVQSGITLDVNQTVAVTIQLSVGTVEQKTEVHANAPLVETSVTSLGKTVDQRDVLDLPLNGRNFSQLGLLQPGVVPITPGLAQAGGSLRNGQAYAVNGQRPESNNFLIDGSDNFNSVDGGFVIQPPIDSIAEFRILTHTANAEFGHNSGSTTNIITRSGGNCVSRCRVGLSSQRRVGCEELLCAGTEPLKQNQFGGTFGGPIKKDKTFFFLYYEGLRNRQGETSSATVATAAERTGNFAELCPEGFTGGFCNDPQNQLVNEFSGQPFPNNQIPFINPISQNLLAFFPLPNAPALGPNGFTTTETLVQNYDQFGTRIDHYLTSRDVLNFRYSFTQGNTLDPLSTSGANVPGFPVGEDQRAQNFVAQETHTFSPNLTGLVRFTFMRNKYLFDEHINHTLPSDLGFEYSPQLDAAAGPPFVQVSGYAAVGDPITGPRNTYENNLNISGSMTWIHGRHEFKFGGGYGHDQINVLFGIATNGFFVFAPAPINDAFASFLIGQPVLFLQGGGDPSRGLRGNNFNLYAQDTFKLSSRLTLNLGLRYDVPSPYTEIHNRQNLFEPGRQSTVIPTAPPGLVYPGDPGVPDGLIPTERRAFAPRLGVAWDPNGKGQWLVTAAYGVFFDPYYNGQGGPLQTPNSAPPYLQTPQASFPSNFANPFEGQNPFAAGLRLQ